ncbi:hepatoma up-regulated protein, putative [Pediculus humanus corporis]|uniref:Hepatoma up-regulated protein, putative n=1 Tax=Pediculus humanus subsp. corporis TaxID=121224 RepID=E0V9E5_PEDHC|nr:hepatoma up-regulated protein, putative [Pediculus humanus corporis]EEB10001.1 hepatoma up-regulated protein, putative [Pediculus humanus corporis]
MNSYEEFRDVLRTERENLDNLSDFWHTKVNSDKNISRDTQGRIRSVVGKTRLLLSEKFKQFEGLIDQSENKTSEKEITLNDLQGFWELILIQVNEIKSIYRDLENKKPRRVSK